MNIAEKILRAKADYDAVFEAGKKAVGEVLKFTDVSSNAYRSIVPNGVEPFARVNKIGGMSYKTRNLIPFPYDKESYTRMGLTATANSDGSITLKGTATEVGRFNTYFISSRKVFFPKGTTFSMAQQPNATYSKMWYRVSFALGDKSNSVAQLASHSTQTKTLDKNADILQLDINYWTESVGEVVDVTFYPMLNEGTTALPYEPYFEGLRSASVSELKSEGANEFDINAEPLDLYNTKMTRLEDGLKLNTTQATSSTTSNFYYRSDQIPTNCKKAYFSVNATPIGKITKGLFRIWIKDKNGNYLVSAQAQGVGNLKNSIDIPKAYQDGNGYIQILLYSCSGEICDAGDGVIYNQPMLTFDVNVPYTKYKDNIDTLSVPEAVKSLDGYGLGVNSEYYNYIDFERKVFVQKVKAVDMGTLKWSYRFSNDRHIFATGSLWGVIQGQISQHIPINALSADYRAVTVDSTWVDRDMAYNSSKVGNTTVEFVDNRYTDADTFKNAVNGKILVYALAEPIETDISAYLKDEYIEVEGGGTVTAVNEYGYDVPTNISYLIDTQGGLI